MTNMRLNTANLRNPLADAVIAAIDAGAGPGTLKFYDGSQPANADTAITTQNLLGTLTFSDPCGTKSNGVITFDVITEDASADASGTATWARIQDSAGNIIFDCDVGLAAASIIMNDVDIVAGGPIQLASFAITVPAG